MRKDAKIFVSGHRGLVGSAIVRRLVAGGYKNIVTRTRAELDLLDQRAVNQFLWQKGPTTYSRRRQRSGEFRRTTCIALNSSTKISWRRPI